MSKFKNLPNNINFPSMEEEINSFWKENKIFEKSDELIARSMLVIKDYKLWRGWSGGSSKYFFGKNLKDNAVP